MSKNRISVQFNLSYLQYKYIEPLSRRSKERKCSLYTLENQESINYRSAVMRRNKKQFTGELR